MKKNTITNEIRNSILNDSRHGEYRRTVAERYGVSLATVCKIVKSDARSDWSHKGGLHCGGNFNMKF